jgi:hypothetical protein
MTDPTLDKIIAVKGRFQRSVQLARDWNDQRGLEEYLLTPTGNDIVKQIVEDIKSPERQRAWSITGPYGTGKSAFALFLTDLLVNKPPKHVESRSLRRELGFESKSYVPILIVGQRASLVPELLSKLSNSFENIDAELSKQIKEKSKERPISDREVVALFEQAAKRALEKGHDGLLLIVDEFGKFLEYAAQNPATEDLLVLQDLAELTARSEASIVFITILHSAFAEYLNILEESRRVEWKKVQGRFADIAFLEPPEQFLRLISAALDWQDYGDSQLVYSGSLRNILSSSAFNEANMRFPTKELLPACAPLHPLTALLLWPLFRSKLAQNERSLFAFLMDRGPFGFQEFLALSKYDRTNPELYRINQLYDYVTSTLGAATFLGDSSRRWGGIDSAVNRVNADAPSHSRSIVKVIGLLNLYGAAVGLRASEELLELALNNKEAVREAITYLERASIIVYRRYDNTYALWEGSDVDIDAWYDESLKHVGHGNLAARLKRVVDLRPLVAKAHYIKSGTLRFFNVDIIDGFEKNLQKTAVKELHPADGQLTYVLTIDKRERETLIECSKTLTAKDVPQNKLRLFAFPKPIVGLEKALTEVESWVWVSENVQELQGDPVAKREVRARLGFAQNQLRDIAGEVFGLRGYLFNPTHSNWIQDGDQQQIENALQFHRWLSKLCDEVYYQAPDLHNELLNREIISSASTAARRLLIEAMIECETEPRLGITGTPAELSMYRALLEEGGFHQLRDGNWQFGKPAKKWHPVWQAMVEFLMSSEKGRRPILELFSILRQPPFGLREGPAPVLFCVLLLVYKKQTALYEDGLFVPKVRIEVFERLIRVPESFEVQFYDLEGSSREAFKVINDVLRKLNLSGFKSNEPSLLEVIQPLILFAARLPDFSKRTKRTDPIQAAAVRDALLNARDPLKLLMKDLPDAVGVSLDDDESIRAYAEKLEQCLLALQRAYPNLLDDVENQLRTEFNLYGISIEARDQLRAKVEPLIGYSSDQTLSLFVKEASRIDERDWREVLARVINKGMPPTHWHDADIVDFQVRLRQLRSDFVRLQELLAEKNRAGSAKIIRIGLLDGKLEELRETFAVPPELETEVENLSNQIRQLIEDNTNENEKSRKVRIAALARVVGKYLQNTGRFNNE